MRNIPRLPLAAALAILVTAPAGADLGAGGNRIVIGGGPGRPHMTYGHPDDPELYAPVMARLGRLGVRFERRGDEYLVYYKGSPIDQPWPIVRSPDAIPETAEEACVLETSGQRFVPLKRLAELTGIEIKWEPRQNLVTLLPGVSQPARAVQINPQPEPDVELVRLKDVTFELQQGAPVIRVASDGPIVPRWFMLKGPDRLVVDFDAAEWRPGIQMPAGQGPVSGLRTGSPSQGVARLVVDLSSGAIKINSVVVDSGEVVARLGTGREAKVVTFARNEAARIQAIVRRRTDALTRLSSRRAPVTGSVRPAIPTGIVADSGANPGVFNLAPVAGRLDGRTIMVDAGHGGRSGGAQGSRHNEKDLCLKMALAVRDSLTARGARVLMTRDRDVEVSLPARSTFANQSNCDIFISIHCNSTLANRAGKIRGTETYWYGNPESRTLAQHLHPRVVATVQARDGGVRGNRSFWVLRKMNMPSVLLEIGYINHPADEALLSEDGFHQRLATNIAHGVVSFFNAQ